MSLIQKCISISRVGRVGGPPFSSLLLLTTFPTGKVIRFPGTALNSEFAVSDLLVLVHLVVCRRSNFNLGPAFSPQTTSYLEGKQAIKNKMNR